jgi:hypothetical protein
VRQLNLQLSLGEANLLILRCLVVAPWATDTKAVLRRLFVPFANRAPARATQLVLAYFKAMAN